MAVACNVVELSVSILHGCGFIVIEHILILVKAPLIIFRLYQLCPITRTRQCFAFLSGVTLSQTHAHKDLVNVMVRINVLEIVLT